MGCLFPVKAYRSSEINPATGKRPLVFRSTLAHREDDFVEVPCNNCIGCKLERARQWSIRMMHEARYHDRNCFLTLTYNDQALPQDYGLDLRHWQLFFKKLRMALTVRCSHVRGEHSAHIRAYAQHHTIRIRFFACGEYGDGTARPHYHAIVFGYDPPDKVFHSVSKSGEKMYVSPSLEKLWGHGHVKVQDVTLRSCNYVARYVTKKIKGNDQYQADHYYRLSPVDGQYHSVRPEFAVMSRKPGIAYKFFQEFKGDIFPSGYLIVDGRKQRPPAYYLKLLTQEEQDRLKLQTAGHRKRHKQHSTMERRRIRAEIVSTRAEKLKRTT